MAHATRTTVRAGALLGAAAAGLWAALLPRVLKWGATDDEVVRPLPGDQLVDNPMYVTTRAITVAAPAAAVWPWLVQLGQNRGGFYSYDFFENVFRLDIHNADRVHDEWQGLRVGEDFVTLDPDGAMKLTIAVMGLSAPSSSWPARPGSRHRSRATSSAASSRSAGASIWSRWTNGRPGCSSGRAPRGPTPRRPSSPSPCSSSPCTSLWRNACCAASASARRRRPRSRSDPGREILRLAGASPCLPRGRLAGRPPPGAPSRQYGVFRQQRRRARLFRTLAPRRRPRSPRHRGLRAHRSVAGGLVGARRRPGGGARRPPRRGDLRRDGSERRGRRSAAHCAPGSRTCHRGDRRQLRRAAGARRARTHRPRQGPRHSGHGRGA